MSNRDNQINQFKKDQQLQQEFNNLFQLIAIDNEKNPDIRRAQIERFRELQTLLREKNKKPLFENPSFKLFTKPSKQITDHKTNHKKRCSLL